MRRRATITRATPLYATASPQAAVLAELPANAAATAIAASADGTWYEVVASAGTGWIAAASAVLHDVLIADLYPFDNRAPSWTTAQASPQLAGAILKASEGIAYGGDLWWASWFRENWGPLRSSAGARYGESWFRGAYHFYRFDDGTPQQQAQLFLDTVAAAGGWDIGDLPPVVDVELGGDNAAVAAQLDAAEIIAQITAYTQALKQALGCPVMLYGGEALRSKGITDHLGCEVLWTADYAGALAPRVYEEAGWTGADTVLWQYTDGDTNYTGFPTKIPGLGGDLSVFRPNDLEALARLAWRRGSSN